MKKTIEQIKQELRERISESKEFLSAEINEATLAVKELNICKIKKGVFVCSTKILTIDLGYSFEITDKGEMRIIRSSPLDYTEFGSSPKIGKFFKLQENKEKINFFKTKITTEEVPVLITEDIIKLYRYITRRYDDKYRSISKIIFELEKAKGIDCGEDIEKMIEKYNRVEMLEKILSDLYRTSGIIK